MTTSAHSTKTPISGASRQVAIAHVRTIQNRRTGVGWLDCDYQEFLQLLARHESGEINLLTMDAETTDPVEPDDNPDEPLDYSSHIARRANGTAFSRTYAVLQKVDGPLTTPQIVQMTGFGRATISKLLSENSAFSRVGFSLWTLSSRVVGSAAHDISE